MQACDLIAYDAPPGALAGWAAALDPAGSHLIRETEFGDDIARIARRFTGTSVGIVLSGGGAPLHATGACRLVGEAYPFGPRTRLVLTWDIHKSVNGIREFARSRGAATRYVPFSSPELRVDDDAIRQALAQPGPLRAAWRAAAPSAAAGPRRGLPAYPAQSNFSGVQHPLAGSRRRTSTATTCCWTRRRTCRRTGWTCQWSSPISCRSAGTRCSAIRPASAA